MQWFIYLFKVSLCSGVFFLFYRLIISKFTFFNFNRWYLIGSLVISFIIPALTIEVKKEAPAIFHKSVNDPISFSTQTFNERDFKGFEAGDTTTRAANWESLFLESYWIVSFLLLLKLLLGIVQIVKSRKKYSREREHLILVEPDSPFKNSSFFNYLFIDRTLPEDAKKQIIAHEQVHINSRHFADKLIANINVVILWFNPFAYAYLHAIDANHEYEADYKTAKNQDKQSYANLILSLTHISTKLFINHFGKLPVKKRIKMLYKKPTNRMKKLTYLSVLPLVALCCLAFMNKEEVLIYSKPDVNADQLSSAKKPTANQKVTAVTKHQPVLSLSSSDKKTEEIIRHLPALTISTITEYRKNTLNTIHTQPDETFQTLLPSETKSVKEKKPEQYVLVIDPGHGGKDDATKGINRVKEKDMNLTAALILKEEAEKRGIKVIMTRNSDVFVTLHERVAMQNGANAFISIHHNSQPISKTKQHFQAFNGLEVIASEQSALKASRVLGSEILQSLKNIKGIDVRDSLTNASIYVVREAKIPSILVEMGNISYKDSFNFVKKETNIRKICNLILDGFINFES